MELLESIGILSLIFGGIYFLLNNNKNKEYSQRLKNELIKNNSSCNNLIFKYNQSIDKGKPIMTYTELMKEIDIIIKDPAERQESINRINRIEDNKEKAIQENRENRKIGYKYQIEIFEIFDTNRELSYKELHENVELKFRLDQDEATKLLKLWKKNQLINKCYWNSKKWEVGSVLTSDSYSIDKNDMTRNKWLIINNKILDPISFEEEEYDDGLPF
jgi:hypothetical protein